MRKKTKGRKIQVIGKKVINHNWTYRISGNRTKITYKNKHYQ